MLSTNNLVKLSDYRPESCDVARSVRELRRVRRDLQRVLNTAQMVQCPRTKTQLVVKLEALLALVEMHPDYPQ